MEGVTKQTAIMERPQILKNLETIRNSIEMSQNCLSLVLQTFAQNDKTQHLEMTVAMFETMTMLLELNEDLYNYMKIGLRCYELKMATNKYRDERELKEAGK